MPFLSLSQARLFYAVHQPPDAHRTLLLVHGAGGSRLLWPGALRRLRQTAVYALDLAGHGRSNLPGYQTIDAYARDVLEFISALSLNNAVVLGHSMGGAVAQMVGLAQPPEIKGLILLGTGARLRVAPNILQLLEADFIRAVDLLNQYYWGKKNASLLAANRRSMLACSPEVMLGDFLACDQFDIISRLAEITLPALVISGSADQMTPPKYGHLLAEKLPRAQLALIDQAGHMIALEYPQKVANLVIQFLEQLQE